MGRNLNTNKMSSFSSSIVFASFLVVLWSGKVYASECYQSIISFGDSLSDTGNLEQLGSLYPDIGFDCPPPCCQNGRCSNGGLIIDFLAGNLGLPIIPTYINEKHSSGREVVGVNYAVSGATALDPSFFKDRWSEINVLDISLGFELDWFKQSLPFMCGNTSDCRNFIGDSLILLGAIGSNDYNHMLSAGILIDDIKPYVPNVTDVIISAVHELVEMGAQTIVVPGVFPFGCFPAIMTLYGSDGDEYDPITGCLSKFNEFAEYHNNMLQTKLNETRGLYPNVNIMYADHYNAVMQAYRSPQEFGFTNEVLKACYGGGGPLNFNTSTRCGDASMTVCDEPDKYLSWDGIHFTEATYKLVAKSLFQGPFTTPEFRSLCPKPLTSRTGVRMSSI